MVPLDSVVFIENVKARCKQLGTTPTAACVESGAGKNLITYMKKGTMPSIEKVQKLADYLQCSVSDLTGETPQPAGDPELAAFLDAVSPLTAEERAKVQGFIQGLIAQRK